MIKAINSSLIMTNLVNDISDQQKIESSPQEVDLEYFNLFEVIT